MEFASREEMLRFEREREQYLTEWIAISNRRNLGTFYKRLFVEAFHPKYRAIKKMYEGYHGGWYRDEHGRPTSAHVWLIDTEKLSDGEICVERDDTAIYGVYVYAEGVMHRISLDEYKKEN